MSLNRLRDAISPNRNKGTDRDPSERPHGAAHGAEDGERGRTVMTSTGRGGAGNFLRSRSRDVDAHGNPIPNGDDEKISSLNADRSRSGSRTRHTEHVGRGGAGNIRSPSRDPQADIEEERKEEALEADAEKRYAQKDAHEKHSTGRGGLGNIIAEKIMPN